VGVDADAAATRGVEEIDLAWARAEVVVGVFRVDAALDGVVTRSGVAHMPTHGFAGSDADLLFDEVTAVDFLSDGMLHLDAGVHLHEVEISVIVDKILDRAAVFVTNLFGQLDGSFRHALSKLLILRKQRGGSFLDDFLVSALK